MCIFVLLRRHGDIELNSGPRKSKGNTVSVCHWNINSITTHDFSKLTQLGFYMLIGNFPRFSTPDNLVDIQGYNLVRSDHPDDTKKRGVYIYYKQSLPVRVINLPYFKEALLLEMSFNKKKVIVSVIYRFQSNLQNLLSDITNANHLYQ